MSVFRYAQVFGATLDPRRKDNHVFDELGLDRWTGVVSVPVEGALAEKLRGKLQTSTGASLDHLFPTGGLEIDVKPGEKPAKNIPIQEVDKAQFDSRIAELGVKSFNADSFREGVYANWGERFLVKRELSGERQPPRSRGPSL